MFILHIIIIGGGEIVDDIQSGITIPETWETLELLLEWLDKMFTH